MYMDDDDDDEKLESDAEPAAMDEEEYLFEDDGELSQGSAEDRLPSEDEGGAATPVKSAPRCTHCKTEFGPDAVRRFLLVVFIQAAA